MDTNVITESTPLQRKNMDILDLAKFVMSFFVVAIHSELFPTILYPWLRVAVPIFFLISGYILFCRINGDIRIEKNACVVRYVRRNLKLYIVWFIILLPITVIVRRGWFADGIAVGIYQCVRSLLFGSTFGASWFLTAGVTATLLIHGMSKKMRMRWVLLVAFICYALCCMNSRYQGLAESVGLKPLLDLLELLFGGIENSFFVALLWISMGKALADKKQCFCLRTSIVGTVVFGIVLYVEYVVSVQVLNGAENADCYWSLVPFCLFLFSLLINYKGIHVPHAKTLRTCSTVIYVSHKSFLSCLNKVLSLLRLPTSALMLFVVTSTSLTLISLLLIHLSKYSNLRKLSILW